MPTSVSMIWVSVAVNLAEIKSFSGSPCGVQHELRKPQPSYVVQHLPVMACTFLCLGAACQPSARDYLQNARKLCPACIYHEVGHV